MASHVICKLCKESISYTPSEVWKVGYHLQTKHSQDEVAHFSAEDDGRNDYRYIRGRRKRKMYKTTGIEK